MRRSTSRASNERFKADRSGTEEWWCLPDRGSRSRGSGRADTDPRRANDRRPAAARHQDDLRPRPESGPRDGIGTHPERIERCPREFHDPAGNRIRRSDFQTGLRVPVPERVLDGGGRYFLGSVQAITATGEVIGADASGSRQAFYVFGPPHVIWVAGINKLVPTLEDGLKRLREIALPLEDRRMKRLGAPGSHIGKLIIFEREQQPGRITLVLVGEPLGF